MLRLRFRSPLRSHRWRRRCSAFTAVGSDGLGYVEAEDSRRSAGRQPGDLLHMSQRCAERVGLQSERAGWRRRIFRSRDCLDFQTDAERRAECPDGAVFFF